MLQGLKVVEFSTYVAGPSAAMVMADWGAEVIKVESRAGDPTRHTIASSPHLEGNPVFEFENRGKRGVVIDITKPGGRDALVRMLKDADAFITNLRPRALKRARLAQLAPAENFRFVQADFADAAQLLGIHDGDGAPVIARHIVTDADGGQLDAGSRFDLLDHPPQVLFQVIAGIHRQG